MTTVNKMTVVHFIPESMTNGETTAIKTENRKATGYPGSASNWDGKAFSPGGYITLYPKALPATKSKIGRKNIQTPIDRMRMTRFILGRVNLSKGGATIHSFVLKSFTTYTVRRFRVISRAGFRARPRIKHLANRSNGGSSNSMSACRTLSGSALGCSARTCATRAARRFAHRLAWAGVVRNDDWRRFMSETPPIYHSLPACHPHLSATWGRRRALTSRAKSRCR